MFIAERQGFEPRVPRSTTVFKTAAIDHSATSPKLFLRVSCFSKAMQRYALFWNLQIFGNIFLIFLFNPFLEPGNRPSLLRRQKPDLQSFHKKRGLKTIISSKKEEIPFPFIQLSRFYYKFIKLKEKRAMLTFNLKAMNST